MPGVLGTVVAGIVAGIVSASTVELRTVSAERLRCAAAFSPTEARTTLLVQPKDAPSFRIEAMRMVTEAELARARTGKPSSSSVPVRVEKGLSFSASSIDVSFHLDRLTTPVDRSGVEFPEGMRVFDVAAEPDGLTLRGTLDFEYGAATARVRLSCDDLRLPEQSPPRPPNHVFGGGGRTGHFIEQMKERSWLPRGRVLELRNGDRYGTKEPLILRITRPGIFLFTGIRDGSTVDIIWIRSSIHIGGIYLSGQVPLSQLREVSAQVTEEPAPKLPPWQPERCDDPPGVYRGPAKIAVGTPVYAQPGRGEWATILDDKDVEVRYKEGDPWAAVTVVPGLFERGGCDDLAHAWIATSALSRPAPEPPLPRYSLRTTQAAPLTHARAGHTATRLLDGDVLVAGGEDQYRGVAPVERYDLKQGRWIAEGSLTAIRFQHTATRLADGRVLIAGGVTPEPMPKEPNQEWLSHPLASTEIYDPRTRRVSPTGAMVTGRDQHTATLLNDGRVLVVGGRSSTERPLDSAEIYDLRTGIWRRIKGPALPRVRHSATLLPDGRVLVAGGVHTRPGADFWEEGSLTATEIFDPAREVWEPGPELPGSGLQGQAAARLPSGAVLLNGGYAAQLGHLGGLSPGGFLLQAGGAAWIPTRSVDPDYDRWASARVARRRIGREPQKLYDQVVTALARGGVLISGRDRGRSVHMIFNEERRAYVPTEPPALNTTGHTSTLLPDGRVLIAGGSMQESVASALRATNASFIYEISEKRD